LTWPLLFGTPDVDDIGHGVVASSAAVYFVGSTDATLDKNCFIGDNPQAFLLAASSNGVVWSKTWGKGKEDEARGVAVDDNGLVYVVGRSGDIAWTRRYSSSGALQRTGK
jgi:hypothetical protein